MIGPPHYPHLDRRGFLRTAGLAALGTGLSACGFAGDSNDGSGGSSDGVVMTGWGSDFEKKNVQAAVKSFNESGKGHDASYQFVPNDGYQTKMNTLVAADNLPDLSYQAEGFAMRLGSQGRLVNILDYREKYPALADMLPTVIHQWEQGKALTQLAVEMMMMWYNVDAIRDAGVPTPPAEAARAWSWDEFVQYCDALTVDNEGRHPSESGFDTKQVKQWGTLAPTSWTQLYGFLHSNGADIVDRAGTTCVIDSPEAVTVISNVNDLMWEHHVAPSPTQVKTFAATFTADLLESRHVATVLDGQWNLLDLGQLGFDYDIGVLPSFQEPKTVNLCCALVASADSDKIDETIELLLYLADPAKNELYARGLWMPLQKKYYTDPKAIASWTDNSVHPKGFKTAALDYLVENGVSEPSYRIKNWDRISSIFAADLDGLFSSGKTGVDVVREVLQKTKEKIQPLLQGVFPDTLNE